MYKRIDAPEDIKGYSFNDAEGDPCYVNLPDSAWGGFISIGWASGHGNHVIAFDIEDIPKLIKALEAAYNHKEV